MQPQQPQQPGQQRNLQIKIPDEILKGAYANAMSVIHSKEEFILDFLNLYPHQGNGIVMARVVLSPGHLKRVVAALQDNIQKYEKQFGKLAAAEAPQGDVGFH